MKVVFGMLLILTFSAFAQNEELSSDQKVRILISELNIAALKNGNLDTKVLTDALINNQKNAISKIYEDAGNNPLTDVQKMTITKLEFSIAALKDNQIDKKKIVDALVKIQEEYISEIRMNSKVLGVAGGYAGGAMTGGHAGGYPGGIAGGAMVGGIQGGYNGGYVGGAYPTNTLWNCSLSHDEKEIHCANGKKYKQTEDSDNSDRSEVYKQQWIPNVLEIEKKKVKQE